MCEFVSWVEHNNKFYFLSGNQVFRTKKGKELREYCGRADDLTGHGAIRHYYGLGDRDGINRECTDFSSPANFPPEIVSAIKSGAMRGLAVVPELLTQQALAEYERVTQQALWDLFSIQKNRIPAWRD